MNPSSSSSSAGGGAGEGPSPPHDPASPRKPSHNPQPSSAAGAGGGGARAAGSSGDRWTGLLAALWGLLFLALCVNKQELWVVLAGLVGYACLCFCLDVGLAILPTPLWDGPVKASQTARLSNSLVCVAHAIAMGLAAGVWGG